MATKNYLKIDVTDWAIEHDEIEPQISNEDDLIGLAIRPGMNTAKVARLAIISRERGNAPADILPANKPLLNSGGAVAISTKIAQRHKEVQLKNGKTLTVREFVAPVRDEDEGQATDDAQVANAPSPLPETLRHAQDATFVNVQSDEAKGRALDYLYKIVPGYIMGRLKIIAVNGGDVKAAADELKARIDEMVERLG